MDSKTDKVSMVKVLVTGKGGQLAWELEQTLPSHIEVISLGIEELDITNQNAVYQACSKYKPNIVINAAAYTAVDKAESDQTTAYAVNEQGSENIALACKEIGASLIHVSTDFVFDGSNTTPYQPQDTPCPINVYGDSKLQGDIKVSQILGNQATIIRTAWVYSAHGNNFVKTMLRLMDEKEQLGIVYDQVGTPTWAKGLAMMIWELVEKLKVKRNDTAKCSDELSTLSEANFPLLPQILHWTDAGVASWYDFAVAIQELALEKGMLNKEIPVGPISQTAYPTPAKRPSFSVIDKTTAEEACGIKTTHWRKQLSMMLDELKATSEEE